MSRKLPSTNDSEAILLYKMAYNLRQIAGLDGSEEYPSPSQSEPNDSLLKKSTIYTAILSSSQST